MTQRGAIRGDGITLLVAGAALGGLLIYSATSGYELPFWPAMAVIGVHHREGILEVTAFKVAEFFQRQVVVWQVPLGGLPGLMGNP